MKINFSNTLATIEPETSQDVKVLEDLRRSTEVLAPGAVYTREFKRWRSTNGKSGWNGKTNIINKRGTILTGLLPLVQERLWCNSSIVPTLVDSRVKPIFTPQTTTIPLRPYQTEALHEGIVNKYNKMWWPRGIFKISTGGGKTELAAALIQRIQVPTLFLVHRRDLVLQAVDRLTKYNIDAGVLGMNTYDPRPAGVTVATIQTITSLYKRARWEELRFLSGVEQVFYDEAHMIAATQAKGNNLVKVSNFLTNAYIRWGLTATPFMRDTYSNWLLQGVTGNILYEVSNADLISLGYLTPPIVEIVKVPKVLCKNKWPECYESGVILNSGRTKLVIKWLNKVPKPCLIMCNRIPHARIIQHKAKQEGIDLPMLQGNDPVAKRKEMIQQLRDGKIDHIVCTTIFDEGIDIPELRSIILAGAGKSKIKQLQKIGRGLRIADGKDRVIVVDFYDTSSKLLEKHSKERLEVWKEEGFEIRKE